MLAEFARVLEERVLARAGAARGLEPDRRAGRGRRDRDPGYWVRQVREAVRFADGVAWLAAHGVTDFLEIGPDATLTSLAAALPGKPGGNTPGGDTPGGGQGPARVAVAAARAGQDEVATLTTALAHLYTRGTAIDWPTLHPAPRIDLPTYAFTRQRYWLEGPSAAVSSADGADEPFWTAVEQEDLETLTDTLGASDAGERAPLRAVLPMLSRWRRQQRERSAVQSLRYRVAWRPVTEPAAQLDGTWVLVTAAWNQAEPVADSCAEALAHHGAQVVRVALDSRFAEPETVAEQVRTALGGAVPAGVLSLLALSDEADPEHPGVSRALAATFALVRALGEPGMGAPLWCATQGAVATADGSDVHPGQASIWGLGRVAALEYPDRWGGLVDLPEVLDPAAGQRLCAVLAGARAKTSWPCAAPGCWPGGWCGHRYPSPPRAPGGYQAAPP